jgi:hypothetical protein
LGFYLKGGKCGWREMGNMYTEAEREQIKTIEGSNEHFWFGGQQVSEKY